MKKPIVITLLFLCFSLPLLAQPITPKDVFLEKWTNSKEYLLGIAEAMPEEAYDFKPTERQMTFAEQLIHITKNMEWLSSSYFGKSKTAIDTETKQKEAIIKQLNTSFDAVYNTIKNTTDEALEVTVEFFAGPKSKLQILNLLQDHVTHHRGQLIVYLNLNEIEPPRYSGW